MRTFLVDTCHLDRTFRLLDSREASEAEFELVVAQALQCAYPDYHCVRYTGSYVLDGDTRQPDLALVARNFSHWFVIEVELASHSFEYHVLPQVRAFRYGQPRMDGVKSLARALELDEDSVRNLVVNIPMQVAVVLDQGQPIWTAALQGLDAQVLVISQFVAASSGVKALEISGNLLAVKQSVGFAEYRAIDRSLRLPLSTPILEGAIQLGTSDGIVSSWIVTRDARCCWLTRQQGIPDLPDGTYVQIVRAYDGQLSLRSPRGATQQQ